MEKLSEGDATISLRTRSGLTQVECSKAAVPAAEIPRIRDIVREIDFHPLVFTMNAPDEALVQPIVQATAVALLSQLPGRNIELRAHYIHNQTIIGGKVLQLRVHDALGEVLLDPDSIVRIKTQIDPVNFLSKRVLDPSGRGLVWYAAAQLQSYTPEGCTLFDNNDVALITLGFEEFGEQLLDRINRLTVRKFRALKLSSFNNRDARLYSELIDMFSNDNSIAAVREIVYSPSGVKWLIFRDSKRDESWYEAALLRVSHGLLPYVNVDLGWIPTGRLEDTAKLWAAALRAYAPLVDNNPALLDHIAAISVMPDMSVSLPISSQAEIDAFRSNYNLISLGLEEWTTIICKGPVDVAVRRWIIETAFSDAVTLGVNINGIYILVANMRIDSSSGQGAIVESASNNGLAALNSTESGVSAAKVAEFSKLLRNWHCTNSRTSKTLTGVSLDQLLKTVSGEGVCDLYGDIRIRTDTAMDVARRYWYNDLHWMGVFPLGNSENSENPSSSGPTQSESESVLRGLIANLNPQITVPTEDEVLIFERLDRTLDGYVSTYDALIEWFEAEIEPEDMDGVIATLKEKWSRGLYLNSWCISVLLRLDHLSANPLTVQAHQPL